MPASLVASLIEKIIGSEEEIEPDPDCKVSSEQHIKHRRLDDCGHSEP